VERARSVTAIISRHHHKKHLVSLGALGRETYKESPSGLLCMSVSHLCLFALSCVPAPASVLIDGPFSVHLLAYPTKVRQGVEEVSSTTNPTVAAKLHGGLEKVVQLVWAGAQPLLAYASLC
jgi:hypothetical protein